MDSRMKLSWLGAFSVCVVLGLGPLIEQSPMVGLLIAGVAISWVSIGLLSRRVAMQGVRPLVVGTGAIWVVQYLGSWPEGPGAVISALAIVPFWTFIFYSVLNFPRELERTRIERWAPVVLGTYLTVTAVLALLVTEPEWLGYSESAWWPGWLVSTASYDMLLRACSIGDVAAASMAVIVTGLRLVRMRELDRRAFAPLMASALLLAVATSIIDARNSWYSMNPADLLAEALLAALLPMCVLALDVVHRFQTMRIGQRASRELLAASAADRIQRSLRTAFGDPDLSVFYYDQRHDVLRDEGGAVMDPDRISDKYFVRYVHAADGRPLAVITGDLYLNRHSEAIERAADSCIAAVERDLLRNDLAESRSQASAAVAERKRLERDLHDIVQQRILAARLRSSMLKGHVANGSLPLLEQLEGDLSLALGALRRLAHGLAPEELERLGLGGAIADVCAVLPVVTSVEVTDSQLPRPLELVAYSVVCEALNNVIKHSTATEVRVRVETLDSGVVIEVADDGAESNVVPISTPRSIDAQVREIGGSLEVRRDGRWTRVVVELPRIA